MGKVQGRANNTGGLRFEPGSITKGQAEVMHAINQFVSGGNIVNCLQRLKECKITQNKQLAEQALNTVNHLFSEGPPETKHAAALLGLALYKAMPEDFVADQSLKEDFENTVGWLGKKMAESVAQSVFSEQKAVRGYGKMMHRLFEAARKAASPEMGVVGESLATFGKKIQAELSAKQILVMQKIFKKTRENLPPIQEQTGTLAAEGAHSQVPTSFLTNKSFLALLGDLKKHQSFDVVNGTLMAVSSFVRGVLGPVVQKEEDRRLAAQQLLAQMQLIVSTGSPEEKLILLISV